VASRVKAFVFIVPVLFLAWHYVVIPFFYAPNCSGIPDEGLRDACVISYASSLGVVGFCHEIGDFSRFNDCLWAASSPVADPSVCDLHSDLLWRDVCYGRVAFLRNDTVLCGKAVNLSVRDDCFYRIARRLGNPVFCSMLSSADLLSQCHIDAGAAANITVACDAVIDLTQWGNCVWGVARGRGDNMTCGLIGNETLSRWCFRDVTRNYML
jgi:hypothetical protein